MKRKIIVIVLFSLVTVTSCEKKLSKEEITVSLRNNLQSELSTKYEVDVKDVSLTEVSENKYTGIVIGVDENEEEMKFEIDVTADKDTFVYDLKSLDEENQ